MEAQKTINYFQFKHIDSNRPVDPNHVKRLTAAIAKKDLLHVNPIIVNSKMEVIDGQHRLEAAKQLGLYVHYVIDENISKSDIAAINSNTKNWSMLDYITYWATENTPGFDKLTEFMLTYPRIQVSSALLLVSESDVNLHRSVREGIINIGDLEMATKVAKAIDEISDEFLCKFAYEDKFVRAIFRIFKIEGYDHAIMKRKIELNPRALMKCVDVKQYIAMLEEIYNYGSSKNKLRFL